MRKADLEIKVGRYRRLLEGEIEDLYYHCPRNYTDFKLNSHLETDHNEIIDKIDNTHCNYRFCEVCGIAKRLESIIVLASMD